jgi:hypothetical protein
MLCGTLAVIYSNDKAHLCKMRGCFHILSQPLVSRWHSDIVLIVNLFSSGASTEITFSKRELIITIIIAKTFDKMNLTIDAVFNSAKIRRFSLEARELFQAIHCRSQRFITYNNVHFNLPIQIITLKAIPKTLLLKFKHNNIKRL